MTLSALSQIADLKGGRAIVRRSVSAAHKLLGASPDHAAATAALVAELGDYDNYGAWQEAYDAYLIAHHQRAAEILANKLVGALQFAEGDVHGRLTLALQDRMALGE